MVAIDRICLIASPLPYSPTPFNIKEVPGTVVHGGGFQKGAPPHPLSRVAWRAGMALHWGQRILLYRKRPNPDLSAFDLALSYIPEDTDPMIC